MAVSSVHEIWNGRSFDLGDGYTRSYERQFRVITTSTLDGPIVVTTVSGIPRMYDAYQSASDDEEDADALCRRVRATQSGDDPYEWTVVCEYNNRTSDPALISQDGGKPFKGSKEPGTGDVQSADVSPLNKLPDIRWSFRKYTVPAEFGLIENPIDHTWTENVADPVVNSANKKFDPPIEKEDSRLVLTYVRNEPAFEPAIAWQYADSINSAIWLGFPPKMVKCTGIGGVRKFENKQLFWEITYEFEFVNKGTWEPEPWDLSYVDDLGDRIPPGASVATPVPYPLNGSGTWLSQADAQDPTKFHKVGPFAIFKLRDFNALGITGGI